MIEIIAQPGPQHQFLESTADIVLYGGTTGSEKSFCKLMELTRHINHKGFGAVIFRHTSVQVRNEGGLWDTSELIYPRLGGIPKESFIEWELRLIHEICYEIGIRHTMEEGFVMHPWGMKEAKDYFDHGYGSHLSENATFSGILVPTSPQTRSTPYNSHTHVIYWFVG